MTGLDRTGIVVLQFDVRGKTLSDGNVQCISRGGSSKFTNVFSYKNGKLAAGGSDLGRVFTNDFVNVALIFDVVARKYSVAIDGYVMKTGITLDTGTSTTPVNEFRFNLGSATTDNGFADFDNIMLYTYKV